jgi:hypothetical protein
LPQFGKPESFDTYDLVVLMKDSAYFRHNGLMGEEPAAAGEAGTGASAPK